MGGARAGGGVVLTRRRAAGSRADGGAGGRRRAGPGRARDEAHLGDPPTSTPSGPRPRCASQVWFTLRQAELSEVYYPDLGTPALRDLEFAVGDGRRVARETRGTRASVTRVAGERPHLPPGGHRPARALATREDLRRRPGARDCWSTCACVADRAPVPPLRPRRPGALQRRRRRPRPRRGGALVARDDEAPRARSPPARLRRGTSGYAGRRDPWHRLRAARRLVGRRPTRAQAGQRPPGRRDRAAPAPARRTRIDARARLRRHPAQAALRTPRAARCGPASPRPRAPTSAAGGSTWRALKAPPARVAAPALRSSTTAR